MNSIEPILFDWDGSGIQTDNNYQQRMPRWDETADFIFHQATVELCDEISQYTLQEKYSEIVESEIKEIKDVLPLPENRIRMGSVSPRGDTIFYSRGETVVVPSQRTAGVAHLVSNNKNAARDLRGKLANELKSVSERFHGAGVNKMEIYTDEDYTLKNVSHPNAELNITKNEPDEFEEEVLEELKPLSEAFVSNLEVDFVNYSPSPEFDIVYPTSPGRLLQIEVKDYSGTDEEPGEKEAIQKPLRRASLLDVHLTLTVVRGVEEDTMAELKEHSELRNQIQLIRKNELKETVRPLLEQSISPVPGRVIRN